MRDRAHCWFSMCLLYAFDFDRIYPTFEDGLVYGSYWVTFEGMVDNRMSYFFLCLLRGKIGDPPFSSSSRNKRRRFPLEIGDFPKSLSPIENSL